jgi:DNA-binding transcriptional regulator YbjK
MKQKILTAALKVAESTPLWAITRMAVAKRAGCAPSLVTYYLGTRDEMLRTIEAALAPAQAL